MRMLTISILVSMISCAHAEFRTWTSAQGVAVEAEYKGSVDGVAVLQTRNGKECKLSPENLCEADQQYLKDHECKYEPTEDEGESTGDIRLWTDNKGHSINAEYRGFKGGKVILRIKGGKVLTLDVSSLCDIDQAYLQEKYGVGSASGSDDSTGGESCPPRVEIDFKKISDSSLIGSYGDYRDVDLVCAAVIEKTNREPYSGKLTGELYVIGLDKYDSSFVMLDVVKKTFDFKNSREFRLDGEHFRLREWVYDKSDCTEYEGYLVVIKDENGENSKN